MHNTQSQKVEIFFRMGVHEDCVGNDEKRRIVRPVSIW